MSDLIRLKRSSVVGSIPTALEFGEIALNYADGALYYKNSLGVIVALTTGTPAVVVPTDADFANVVLLLHGDGNLTDSSSLARTATAVGTVTSNGAAKFGANSLAFVGSGKLTIPTDASLTFAGDFTVEFWCKFSSLSSTYGAFFAGDTGATQMFLTTQSNGQGIRWGLSATAEYASGSCTWATGQWYHVAVRRASTYVTLWVDGVNVTSGAPTNATTYSGGLALMGGIDSVQDFAGFVDDFRVTKGVARTITVPTAAYPNAGPAVTTPTDAYFSSVSLLLHMDGTAASFVDSSSSPKTITVLGNAAQSATQSKWGGKSAYFDGTSSAGTVVSAASSAFDFGSGDWTIEAWVYFDSVAGNQRVAGGDAPGGSYFSWAWYIASGGTLAYFLSSNGGSWDMASSVSFGSIATGQWYHVALVRQGSTVTPYINGTAGTPSSVSGVVYHNTSNGPFVGSQASSYFSGYIDDFRVTKGVARTITVPTAAFPNA